MPPPGSRATTVSRWRPGCARDPAMRRGDELRDEPPPCRCRGVVGAGRVISCTRLRVSSRPLPIRDRLSRRKQLTLATCALFLLVLAVSGVSPPPSRPEAFLVVLAMLFGLFLALQLGWRCPRCHGSWGAFRRGGPPWRLDPNFRFCPWCGRGVDAGAPSVMGEAMPVFPEPTATIGRLVTTSLPLSPGMSTREAIFRRGRWLTVLGGLMSLALLVVAMVAWSTGRSRASLLLLAGAASGMAVCRRLPRASVRCPSCSGAWSSFFDRPWRLSPRFRCCPWCGGDPDEGDGL